MENNRSFHCILKDNIELIPGCPKRVELELKGVKDGVNVVVIEGSERIDELVAVVSLGEVTKGTAWVEVTKSGEETHRLKKGHIC